VNGIELHSLLLADFGNIENGFVLRVKLVKCLLKIKRFSQSSTYSDTGLSVVHGNVVCVLGHDGQTSLRIRQPNEVVSGVEPASSVIACNIINKIRASCHYLTRDSTLERNKSTKVLANGVRSVAPQVNLVSAV
jgi:hypothetical protein